MKVAAQSSTSLLVSWKPPAAEHSVTGYYVGYKLLQHPIGYTLPSASTASISSSSLAGSASSSSTPSKSLESVLGGVGSAGGVGEAFAYKTVEASVVNAGSDSASGASGSPEVKHKMRTEEQCSLTGLKKHSRYQIFVQAFNSKGAGPPSDHMEAETLEFGKKSGILSLFTPYTVSVSRSDRQNDDSFSSELHSMCVCE